MLMKMITALNPANVRQICIRINNLRKMSYIPGIKSKKMNEQHYMKKDQILKEYTLIYRAPMENYLVISKNITSITAGIVTTLVGYKYLIGEQISIVSNEVGMFGLILDEPDLIIFATGFLLITIVLRIFISKYPLRIYKNENKYVAVFEGQMPLKNSKLYFNKGEVSQSKPSSFNPWAESTFKIKNKSTLLLIDYFKTPSELMNMMIPPVIK